MPSGSGGVFVTIGIPRTTVMKQVVRHRGPALLPIRGGEGVDVGDQKRTIHSPGLIPGALGWPPPAPPRIHESASTAAPQGRRAGVADTEDGARPRKKPVPSQGSQRRRPSGPLGLCGSTPERPQEHASDAHLQSEALFVILDLPELVALVDRTLARLRPPTIDGRPD